MRPLPKREYLVLLIGDVVVFFLSLWLTLLVRYADIPSELLLSTHLPPFAFLFAVWIVVFFLAGLYGKHTRIFKSALSVRIFAAQTINLIVAALFFFFVPLFGIAPKTNLLLYLLISAPLIYVWRVLLFPRLRNVRSGKLKGALIAAGSDAHALAAEAAHHGHYPFSFKTIIDTEHMPVHELVQQACRIAEDSSITFIVVDYGNPAIAAAFPIIYDAAFRKKQFVLADAAELYQEVFDRVPLSLVRYEWILGHIGASRTYDNLKRIIDVFGALCAGSIALMLFPFVALAIKLDDGGAVFIAQERIGRFQKPIRLFKFRTMSGNDRGEYGAHGKSTLTVTRVGRVLRALRIDELPQLWNILRGDLSLVGPRPELPALAAQYSARIPYYNARYLVAPGLTGWAQIKHDRHPHHGTAIEETKEKLSYDLYYLQHRSFLIDLYIIFQTIRVVLTARGS